MLVTASKSLAVGKAWCRLPVRRPNNTFQFQAALTAMLGNLPVPEDSIVHVHRPDDLLPFVLHRVGRRRVCTLHGNPAAYVPGRHGRLVTAMYRLAERSALWKCDLVVAVDPETAFDYEKRYSWLRGRVHVIPNGVDVNTFRPMDAADAKRLWGFRGNVLLYAGRLEPDKRVRDILRAFLSIGQPDGTLVFAGDGSERRRLEAEAGNASVRFLGTVRRDDMPMLINAADAGVLFSDEGLSSFALETLACGRPVISTPTGASPSLIRQGENGYLVSSRAELVTAMTNVLRGSIPPGTSISRTADSYDWSKIGRRLLALYAEA